MDNRENSLLEKLLSGYTVKFLKAENQDEYIDLIKSRTVFMGIQLTVEQKEAEIATSIRAFNDPRSKTVGVFNETGDLIAVTSGYFFDNFPHWYAYRLYQKSEEKSLVAAVKNFAISVLSGFHLTQYAESRGYFTYYNKLSLDHQESWEKGHKLLSEKTNFKWQYNYLWEHIYMPGDTCKFKNHEFFFPDNKIVTVPTVIGLVTLKQEYRRKIIIDSSGIDHFDNTISNTD